jgi:lantibiotic modifying enzyme
MNPNDPQALSVAIDLARYVAKSALWHQGCCTWIGAMPEDGPGGTPVMTYRSLDADLYGGTAGVGLFLAEVAHYTDDHAVRRTAFGAFRHCLLHATRKSSMVGHGFYAGRVGVCYALCRAALLLHAAEFREAAQALIKAPATPTVALDVVECDLMSGVAGTLVGLLRLAEMLDDRELRETAVRLGQEVLRHGREQAQGLGWPSAVIAGHPALLGYSHGASGVATALLALEEVTSACAFSSAAGKALEYERSCYDPYARNWPDLRQPAAPGTPASFATYWCHGAPGVALGRLQALRLSTDDRAREEATVALTTTAEAVRVGLRAQHSNFSLCHGLCGNAEILREGIELLPAADRTLDDEVAAEGIRRFAKQPSSWICGTLGGSTPGLFLGLSGIGHFYLRRCCPDVPSVLMAA